MVDGIESQYSPIIGDVIEPPSYMVNVSQLKQYSRSTSLLFYDGKIKKYLTIFHPIENEENSFPITAQLEAELTMCNLFHFGMIEGILAT